MNPRTKFHLWQARHLLKGVLYGRIGPREAYRILRRTRFIAAYTPGNPPAGGDVVWAHHNGTDLRIIGRRIIPTSTVILGEDDEEESSE